MTTRAKRRRPRLASDLLAVDVGNSKVQAVLVRDGKEVWRWRVDYGAGDAWRRHFAVAAAAARRDGRGTPIVLSSVAPRRAAVITRLLERGLGRRVHRVGWRDPWPFRLDIRHPQTVGADRLANVAGSMALGHTTGIVVDAGTAVTIDVLRHRRFIGGLILPGPALAARALHAHTESLPPLVPQTHAALLGTDTASAMQAGIHHGMLHAVDGITRALRAQLGRRTRVLLTGGGSAVLAAALRHADFEPDLLLHGLRLLWAHEPGRRGSPRRASRPPVPGRPRGGVLGTRSGRNLKAR